MNETLREKEEQLRIETQNYRKACDELAVLSTKVNQHTELMAEKDRTAQVIIVSPFEGYRLDSYRFYTMK
jgi:autophagy-related protein 16-1